MEQQTMDTELGMPPFSAEPQWGAESSAHSIFPDHQGRRKRASFRWPNDG
jgi:hypothetical protein